MRTIDYAAAVDRWDIDDEVTDSDLVGYFSPREILEDPEPTIARKRALLAHWASDVHGVDGAPALRCAAGVTVPIDEILEALARLDEITDMAAIPSADQMMAA